MAGGFQPGCRGRAGGHLGENADGLQKRLIMHQTHTAQAQNIRDFMGIGEHRGRAVGDDRGGKFSRGQHPAFDVHMGIAQARNDIAPGRVDHVGIWANTMACVGADIGKAPLRDGNVPLKDFTGVHVHHAAATDHGLRRRSPGGYGD